VLQALGITDRLKEVLEQIDSPSSSEYGRLKGRFQQHQILLQNNQDLSDEQIQLAVDAILTDEDLDAQMADVLGKEPSRSPFRWFGTTLPRWGLGSGSEQSQKWSPKRLHPSSVADLDFLAALHAISTDQPVYKETAEKIIISAGQQVCIRLKKFLKESLANAEKGLVKVLRQDVERNFAKNREEARLRAEAELRNQVRSTLANEHEIPGNRYVNLHLDHFLSALKLRIGNLFLYAVLFEEGETVLVCMMITFNKN
jgi:hypothetical protein